MTTDGGLIDKLYPDRSWWDVIPGVSGVRQLMRLIEKTAELFGADTPASETHFKGGGGYFNGADWESPTAEAAEKSAAANLVEKQTYLETLDTQLGRLATQIVDDNNEAKKKLLALHAEISKEVEYAKSSSDSSIVKYEALNKFIQAKADDIATVVTDAATAVAQRRSELDQIGGGYPVPGTRGYGPVPGAVNPGIGGYGSGAYGYGQGYYPYPDGHHPQEPESESQSDSALADAAGELATALPQMAAGLPLGGVGGGLGNPIGELGNVIGSAVRAAGEGQLRHDSQTQAEQVEKVNHEAEDRNADGRTGPMTIRIRTAARKVTAAPNPKSRVRPLRRRPHWLCCPMDRMRPQVLRRRRRPRVPIYAALVWKIPTRPRA